MPRVIEFLHAAESWRTGEKVGRLLVQHAAFLSVEALKDALSA